MPYNVGINENAARTLEYAYDDWAIYQLAKALGRPVKEQEKYARRALNYRNLFDPETKLMRGRNEDGAQMGRRLYRGQRMALHLERIPRPAGTD